MRTCYRPGSILPPVCLATALVVLFGLGSAALPVVAQDAGGQPKPGGAAEDAPPAKAKPPAKPAAKAADPADAGEAEAELAVPAKKRTPAKPAAAKKKYDEEKSDDLQKRNRTQISAMLRAGKFDAGQQQAFETYYTTYAFPRWTQEANLSLIAPDFRNKELRVELLTGRSGPVYDRLVRLTLDFMTKAVKNKKYHPAVRYNAMLMIGELDSSIAPPGPKAAISPLPEGLAAILEALKDPDQIDVVRIAAMQGLVRHANAGNPGIPDQVRDVDVLPLLMQIVAAKDPPEGRTSAGHAWIRGLAIEVLGSLRQPGPKGQIAKALSEVVGDSTTPIVPTRLAAARALGMMSYQNVTGVKASEAVLAMAQLAVDGCTAELKRKFEISAAKLDAGGMGPMGAMYGPGMSPMGYGMAGGEEGEETDELAVQFRRRMKTVLAAIQFALIGPDRNSGIKGWAGADSDDKKAAELLDRWVDGQIKGNLSDEKADLLALKKKVLTFRTSLKGLIKDPAGTVQSDAEAKAQQDSKKNK